MAKQIIGELYYKHNDSKKGNITENELGVMFDGKLCIGSTLQALMRYCRVNGYTYQFTLGDDPSIEGSDISELLEALNDDLRFYGECELFDQIREVEDYCKARGIRLFFDEDEQEYFVL